MSYQPRKFIIIITAQNAVENHKSASLRTKKPFESREAEFSSEWLLILLNQIKELFWRRW